MKKILVIRASGGLSNRLQAVAAGVGYCLLTGRTLCVDWRDGMYSDDFSNVFPLWFDVCGVEKASCKEALANGAAHPPFWQEWLPEAVGVEYLFPNNDHLHPQHVQASSIDFTDLNLEHPLLVGWAWDLKPALALAPLLRERFARFAEDDDASIVRRLLTEHILPAADLVAEADSFALTHFGAGTVGLHIRHTDLQSPLEKMLHTLREVARPEDNIFLCTDNRHVQSMVHKLFPRAIWRDKLFQGNDIPLHSYVPGISNVQKGRDALLDMLLLARCQHIIHFRKSSFARIPALLSGLAPEYIHAVYE